MKKPLEFCLSKARDPETLSFNWDLQGADKLKNILAHRRRGRVEITVNVQGFPLSTILSYIDYCGELSTKVDWSYSIGAMSQRGREQIYKVFPRIKLV